MTRELVVYVQRDTEAAMWVATSNDIPGLVTEAETYEHLMERVVSVAPELLVDNAAFVGELGSEPVKIRFESTVPLDRSAA